MCHNKMLTKQLWWCPECGDKWTSMRKRGDVKSMKIVIEFT